MQFCISITNPEALKKWLSIPRQKRSRYVEESLLREKVQNANIEELKDMLLQIMNNSTTATSNVNLNTDIIDEILNF